MKFEYEVTLKKKFTSDTDYYEDGGLSVVQCFRIEESKEIYETIELFDNDPANINIEYKLIR